MSDSAIGLNTDKLTKIIFEINKVLTNNNCGTLDNIIILSLALYGHKEYHSLRATGTFKEIIQDENKLNMALNKIRGFSNG